MKKLISLLLAVCLAMSLVCSFSASAAGYCYHTNQVYAVLSGGVHAQVCSACGFIISTHAAGTNSACTACHCTHSYPVNWVEGNGVHYHACACNAVYFDSHVAYARGSNGMIIHTECLICMNKSGRVIPILNRDDPYKVNKGTDIEIEVKGDVYPDWIYLHLAENYPVGTSAVRISKYITTKSGDFKVSGNTVTVKSELLDSLADGLYLINITTTAGCQYYLIQK